MSCSSISCSHFSVLIGTVCACLLINAALLTNRFSFLRNPRLSLGIGAMIGSTDLYSWNGLVLRLDDAIHFLNSAFVTGVIHPRPFQPF